MGRRLYWGTLLLMPFLAWPMIGAEEPAAELSDAEKAGYAVGFAAGSQLRPAADQLDPAMLEKGLADGLQNKEPVLSAEEMTAARKKLSAALAEARKKQPSPMIGQPAPAWEVEEWQNIGDKESISVEDFKGKVVYLYCFQSWCPGCHSHGFPTMVKLIDHYKGDDDVAFVAVQTVFEGHHVNKPEAAWKTARKFGLTIPVGHSGTKENRPALMSAYHTRGTPWTIIIGPDGTVEYSNFRIESETAIALIDKLKAESK